MLLRTALAQTPPDVAEILKKVSETYQSVSQYEFVVDGTSRDVRTRKAETYHMLFAFKAPNRYRMQGTMPGMRVGDSNLSETLAVHDGSTMWFYFPKSNQYGSFPASALTSDPVGDLGDASPQAMDHFMMWRYRGAADFSNGSKFLREETIEVAGAKVACYVLDVLTVSPEQGGSSAYTWWIDQKRYRVLREDYADSSAVFTSIRLDEPLPDELFTFDPPPGARKLETRQ